jgi:hypothetical protein
MRFDLAHCLWWILQDKAICAAKSEMTYQAPAASPASKAVARKLPSGRLSPDMPSSIQQKVRFPLGQVVATPGAVGLDVDFSRFLDRHSCGDWGIVDEEDWAANDAALRDGGRLVSSYNVIHRTGNTIVWIITEADRSRTTVLLPEDY